MPVYIPHTDGYFAEAIAVLRLCLRSLRATINQEVSVTVIANGCGDEALKVLHEEYARGWIDQLCINQINRGKVDAIVAAARGAFEPLITFTDADVLFKHGWLQNIEKVFTSFPESGFVSPIPNPTKPWYHTSATLWGAGLRGELRNKKVVNEEDLDHFARSIGNLDYFPAAVRQQQLIIERDGQQVLVGGGHFVCTVRREVIAGIPKEPTLKSCDGNSEARWLDQPPDKLGFWRLATTQGFVYHMGNLTEPWMHDLVSQVESEDGNCTPSVAVPPPADHLSRHLPYQLRQMGVRLWRKFNRKGTS
jgi:hypothetical protein